MYGTLLSYISGILMMILHKKYVLILTPWTRVLLEKFIIMFIRVCHSEESIQAEALCGIL